ncbi:class I adenylate-forming enzyme family protein [Kitasatospora kifunensis]|uniref:Acyl-CoA synthetase (AMP-forming)/AMP-acid ligase II n=1 Tax=Kitasatospora kifunensis TaxID=58351 RepID=A0A7W7R3T4_KITKI|nr:class I adenylate-forming enzyme family protein [Kitasatospora kifunensis]MBB4924963.1 acyl-CoA synthetase (AMP-forming)/AMP-acid ligase II [Kitasatospora kifunensis]
MTTPAPSSASLAALARARAALSAPGAPFATVDTPHGPRYAAGPAVLRDFLESTRAHGERPFLVLDEQRYSFAEHYAAAAALAHRALDVYGLRPGDRVAIAMRNLPEWQIAFWATQLAGLIAVPLNAWWTAEELGYALEDCEPALVVADPERAERVEGWLAGRGASGPRPWLLTVGVAAPAGPRVERFEQLPPPTTGLSAPEVAIKPQDDATIMYTSGTTGRPKGVVATQSAWCGAVLSPRFFIAGGHLAAGRDLAQVRPQTVLLSYPFFHVAAFTTLFPLMASGGTAVLMRKWDAEAALELIADHQATGYSGVPTTALDLLDAAARRGLALASLASISTGGAPAPPTLARRIQRQFEGRVEARNGYGLTEVCGGVIANVGTRYLEHPDSIGRPAPALEVRITDPSGARLADGEVGELWLRGQSVFRGYWRQPEATAAAFSGDWFRTGDLALLREGEIFVVDRLKDMVIRGGENVYCGEVEGVLLGHPAVAEAAVLGVPHPALGEEVAAIVRLRPGASVAAQELRQHVAGRLAAFKVPAHVTFRDEPLPRNPAGKVVKDELRAALSAEPGC